MPGIPNIGLSFADSTAQSLNPFAAFQNAFTFAPTHIVGGRGNTNTPTVTASPVLTPTATQSAAQSPTATASTFGGGPVAGPAVPFADGPLGWLGGGFTTPAVTSSGPVASSLVLPAAILGAAVLLFVALRK